MIGKHEVELVDLLVRVKDELVSISNFYKKNIYVHFALNNKI